VDIEFAETPPPAGEVETYDYWDTLDAVCNDAVWLVDQWKTGLPVSPQQVEARELNLFININNLGTTPPVFAIDSVGVIAFQLDVERRRAAPYVTVIVHR
jgi:hypothetical protein